MNNLDQQVASLKSVGYVVVLCDRTATGGRRIALIKGNSLVTVTRTRKGLKVITS